MPLYLFQFRHTAAGWRNLIDHLAEGDEVWWRYEAARDLAQQAGGELQGFWYAYGPWDGYALVELPDNEAAAAVSARVNAARGSEVSTILLLTPDQMYAALRKASGLHYQGPGEYRQEPAS
jgi:uncharacterized protein with GYD domain